MLIDNIVKNHDGSETPIAIAKNAFDMITSGVCFLMGASEGGTSWRVGKHLVAMHYTGSQWEYFVIPHFYALYSAEELRELQGKVCY